MNARAVFVVATIWLMPACRGAPAAEPAGQPAQAASSRQQTAREPVGEAQAESPPKRAQADDSPLAAPPDVQGPPADADRTASGLASKVLRAGTGSVHPNEWDQVLVHYTGWTTDGAMFDSSVERGTPAKFPLRSVVPGWREGVRLMVAGERRRLWIPESLAYGGKAGAPQGMLVFDVELIEIEPGVAPVPAPEDVAAPPKRARKTKSGLRYVALHRNKKRGKRPRATDRVTVHYTGWTTDGTMFDTSSSRGPATFPLGGVIPGWSEGVQLMSVGDKFRFWIPEDLAYQGKPGAPQGVLVFDVELLAIEE